MSPRTVFAPYARLFSVPGARAFFLAGWLARVPMATIGLGSVLLVADRSGSYGTAGLVSGTLALAFAVGSPQWARAMDVYGQGRVLRWSVAASATTGLAFALAVVTGAPGWSWFLLAALTGASAANIGSVVRSRWAHALPEVGQRQTAFAFESVVDEVVFVVGPPLVTVLAGLVAPAAGFLTGLAIGALGGVLLAGSAATEPPVRPTPDSGRRVRSGVLGPALVVVSVAYLALGCVFGAMDVVVVGFAAAQGRPALAGAALAAYAAGSLTAGLVYGVIRLPGTLAGRFVVTTVLVAGTAQGLLLVRSLELLVPAAFLAGLAIAPVLVAGTSLVESRVPREALTEGLAWTATGLTAGVTAGGALAGLAVDAWGAERAFVVPALAAAAVGLLGVGGARALRSAARPGPPRPEQHHPEQHGPEQHESAQHHPEQYRAARDGVPSTGGNREHP